MNGDDDIDDAWAREVIEVMAPHVASLDAVISFGPLELHRAPEVRYAVELGLAVLMDKPIIAVVYQDSPVPDKLRQVADRILVVDPHAPPAPARLAQRVREVAFELATERHQRPT